MRFGARLHIFAGLGGEIDDASRLSRGHGGVGQVELGLVALRLRLREVRLGAFALRLEGFDLPLRDAHRGVRALQRRLRLVELRIILLRVLDGAGAFFRQLLVTRLLLLGEHQPRPRLILLRPARLDLRALHGDLRIDVADAGRGDADLGLRLFDGDAVVARVDAADRGAGQDMLVVGDRNFGHIARNLRRNGDLARGDEGVVCGFEMAAVIPGDITCAQRGCEQDEGDGGRRRPAAQDPAQALFAGWRVGFLVRFGLVLFGARRFRPRRLVRRPSFVDRGLPLVLTGLPPLVDRRLFSFKDLHFVRVRASILQHDALLNWG